MSLSPVLVTGASGFIGSNLVQRLLRDGVDVRVLMRPNAGVVREPNAGVVRNPNAGVNGVSKKNIDGLTTIVAPLTPEGITLASKDCKVVYHLAGLTRASSEPEFLWANAEGTRAAAVGARKSGAKLVYVSSLAAAGPGTTTQPKSEQDVPAPITAYGRSKLEGEIRVQQTEGLNWSIVRPPGVYGPLDKDFLFAFQTAKRGFFPVLGNPKRAYTLIYVEDLLDALIACANNEAANGQIFFAGNEQAVAWQEILETLAQIFNKTFKPIQLPSVALDLAAQLGELGGAIGRIGLINRSRQKDLEAPGWVCNVEKIGSLLGVNASTNLEDGFLKTKNWYEQKGWL